MKPRQLLRQVREELRRDAEIILAHLLKVKVADLHLLEESDLDKGLVSLFWKMLKKREEGIPTAYIIGEWEFFGRTFLVEEGVLVPRPETEILVERVLGLIPQDAELCGLDLGTGTGCIAITLLLERPNLKMWATDVNPVAVRTAVKNSDLHGVSERLKVLKGDLFEPVEGMVFDFIVSNPPYIPDHLWEDLPQEVRSEGKVSVVGGKKGYEFYERIAGRLREFLRPGGFVALEIGHDQGKVVKGLLESVGLRVNIYRDLSGQERVVVGWS